MATFKKLKSSNWRVQVRRKGQYVSNSFRRKSEADAWALETERRIDRGDDVGLPDPRLGRFMQTDPLGYGGGMNMYGYVGGDPVNGTDPSGLIDEIIVIGHRKKDSNSGPGPGGFGGFSGGGGESGAGRHQGVSNKICAFKLGSRIAAGCATVTTDTRLTQQQRRTLAGDFRNFLLGFPNGVNLTGFGKTVTGANAAQVALIQAVTQFVGYAISQWPGAGSELAQAWGSFKSITIHDEFAGANAQINTSINSRNFGKATIFQDAFHGGNNLARTIIHETFHLHNRYIGMGFLRQYGLATPAYNAAHDQLAAEAQLYTKLYGLGPCCR